MRAFALAACTITALVAALATGVRANNSDVRAEAAALMKKALEVSDIRAPGSPPFKLRGTLIVPLQKGQNAIGTYLLDWVSPDRWREEIHVDNYSRIRVGGAGRYWQQRSLNYELIPFYALGGAIGYAQSMRRVLVGELADLKAKISVKDRRISDSKAECVSIDALGKSEFCFDSQTGALLQSGAKDSDVIAYSRFANFQGKLFPSVFEITDDKISIISFRLESIAPLGDADAALFQPLSNADVWPACDVPVAPKLIDQAMPRLGRSRLSGTTVIYMVVGADGAIHNPKVLAASSQQDADATLQALKSWKYQPESCHGVPQPSEVITTLSYQNQ